MSYFQDLLVKKCAKPSCCVFGIYPDLSEFKNDIQDNENSSVDLSARIFFARKNMNNRGKVVCYTTTENYFDSIAN
jgi:hypothetical protein